MRTLVIAFAPDEIGAGAAFAEALGSPFDALLLSGVPESGHGAGFVHLANLGESVIADAAAPAVAALCTDMTHVVAVSSMRSKDLMARIAGVLDAAMVTDVIAVESASVFVRPIVAGSVLQRVETLSSPVVATFRPAGFVQTGEHGPSPTGACEIPGSGRATRVSVSARTSERPDLVHARVIVTGGRPLRDAETFERVIGSLADALGGAVGATRAAVDSGIAANELQVGQTGKIVAPELYIAAGVSGSTQHMAGIKDSKTIVAVNKDPDAPIFEFADLGLVADLFDALPEINSKL